jgi:gliding motility-associated lipoprotein GldJ
MNTNMNMYLRLVFSTLVIFSLASCSKKGSNKNVSSGTGWKINDKKGGFQYASNFKQQETPPNMVSVEGGTFTMGRVQDDVMHEWNNVPSQQHIQSFFMDKHEVTNLMYMEYLDWVKTVFPPTEEQYKNVYYGVVPDTLVWRNRLGFNENMTNNYLRHPAYANYPVVGVNWVQASEYCKWRTNRVNENVLEREGYLKRDAKILDVSAERVFDTDTYINSPTDAFGGDSSVVLQGKRGRPTPNGKNLYATRSSGLILPEFRLPTEAEWEYAAVAAVASREYNLYQGQKKYPWQGAYTRSGSRKSRGDQMANFKMGRGDYGGIAGWSDDGADITQVVMSYPPNDFGLYDMAGNVNEWTADVYRPMVDEEASDFNYHRGNVYTKNKIGADGKFEFVTSENIKYDTLATGKIIARNQPGQIAQVPVDENETYLRQNFDRSDNRNYRDGDKQSSKYYRVKSEDGDNDLKDNKRMYNSPIHQVGTDTLEGNMLRRYDRSEKRTTLVDDDVRIYKGGSWRDRAYWLDPASRRFLPEYIASDDLGFRCAMSKTGPKTDKKTPRGNPKSK